MVVEKDILFNLVYWSNATRSFTDDELFEMLSWWREKNTRLGITGLLLYREGAFIQSLEGDETTVRALYAAICKDDRHFQGVTLQATPIPKRQFPDWSMGFEKLNGTTTPDFPGYNPHPELPSSGDEVSTETTVARQLLATFAQKV